MLKNFLFIFVAVLFTQGNLLFAQSAQNDIKTKPTAKLFDEIIGLYNNKAQSDTSESVLYTPQETRIFRVHTKKQDEYWLYWGWFSAGLPDRPLEERLVHFVEQSGDRWQADIYYIPEEFKQSKQWEKEVPFAGMVTSRLKKDQCDCTFLKTSKTSYKVESTPCEATGAVSEYASFFTLSLSLKDNWLGSNTVFLNKQKEEVFRRSGSLMERISKKDLNRAFDAGKDLAN